MTQPLRWSWAAFLSLFMLLAPLDSFAARAPAKGKPDATKVKKSVAKAKKRSVVKARAASKTRVAAKKKKVIVARRAAPAPLPSDPDRLPLDASVAYVVDQESDRVLIGKNDDDVRPIASLTKLMTGLIVAEAQLPMDEKITITDADVDRLKHSSSRLRVGTELTRRQALHLSLMSSENRASHALARTYPGGVSAFISAMNNKALQLGMQQTHYVDPTGLSPRNQSSARDLAVLADAAFEQPLLRKLSTSPGYQLATGKGSLRYVNSNGLVRAGNWDIGLQKTGYINEAGQCLIVQTKVKGRNLIMVFLDSASKVTRIKDAELVKRWLRQHQDVAGNGDADAS
jgi:serine-type D-Ala-D-Ala endopeptidase (penicillin-binding protein 7)